MAKKPQIKPWLNFKKILIYTYPQKPFEKNKISPQYKQQLYLYKDVFIYLTKLIVN